MRTSALLALADGRTVQARTLDIGKGGAGVICDFNVPVGSTLALRLTLPAKPGGSAVFEAMATVKGCSLAGNEGGFRIGLEFKPLSPAAMAALAGLLP